MLIQKSSFLYIKFAKNFLFGFNIKYKIMAITNFIKNICHKLGSNNKSIYPVIAIATANGIFRPTFTMLKKGENPESKKYAALREGITEVIAVPTYWACGELAAKCGKTIVARAKDIEFAKMEQKGQILAEQTKQEMKSAAIKKGQAGLMLVGVCTAAGLVIPALCSLCVTPIMSKIAKKPDEKQLNYTPQNISTIIPPQKQIVRPIFKNKYSGGMKVGGV